MTTFRGS